MSVVVLRVVHNEEEQIRRMAVRLPVPPSSPFNQ